ncbi:GNAT family N-acetyltransferase [Microbacterium sp. Yaish 1]|uniref:GNAT family N-acetyltransferase n=1 Tax=Microbacterium sp. Yaish 1 TaxID=2025014 RepID=UPI00211B3F67|nr:GNAT family N-acetyltransferase [Microbacterium sp. Yaish 1]
MSRTWGWVSQGQHGLTGLVAILDGAIVGLANLRRFARPSSATIGLYLDDLFTAPEARGAGVASGLLREAASLASAEGTQCGPLDHRGRQCHRATRLRRRGHRDGMGHL